jgi:AbrB family looped-hinge helix DNA binding protein
VPTFRAKVDGNGAVILPSELREQLDIADGTDVEFFLTLDGQVHFHAITGTTEGLAGISFERRSPPLSIREMDDAIAEAVSEKVMASLGGGNPRRSGQAAE